MPQQPQARRRKLRLVGLARTQLALDHQIMPPSLLLPLSSKRATSSVLKQLRKPRNYATYTELPRPPPSKLPDSVTFSEASRPREYYTRPKPRDLPPLQVSWLSCGIASQYSMAAYLAEMACHCCAHGLRLCGLGSFLCLRTKPGEDLKLGLQANSDGREREPRATGFTWRSYSS